MFQVAASIALGRASVMFIEKFFPHLLDLPSLPTVEEHTGTEHTSEVRSSHTNWRADLYAHRYSQLPAFRHHFSEALTEDMDHLCREEFLLQKNITWEEKIANQEIIGNGYGGEAMLQMTQNYVAYSAKEFGSIDRAITEHLVMEEIQDWAVKTADQPGNFVIWISPPGPEYMGVSSLENWDAAEKFCSKVNIKWSEKSRDSKTGQEITVIKTMHLTGWPNVQQLVTFWEEVNQRPFPCSDRASVLTDLIGNLTYFADPSLTPEKILAYISDRFFQSQGAWQFAAELPQIHQPDFWNYEQQLWQKFYLPEANRLFGQIPPNLANEAAYWQSSEYRKVIESLDLLFHFFYRHLQLEIDRDQTLTPFQKAPQKINLLKKTYSDRIKIQLNHKQLTQRQLDRHNDSLASLISVADRVSSVSQCGLLAPFTAPLSAMKNMPTSSSLTMGKLDGAGYRKNRLTQSERQAAHQEKLRSPEYQLKLAEYQRIQTGNYQEVGLVVNGETVYYMVPASFLEGKGCFVAKIKNAAGQEVEVAMGPCDIPLDTVFSDPNENLVYKMTNSTFWAHHQQLYNYVFENEFDQAEEVIANDEQLSATDKTKAQKLLDKLKTKILKPTIGLSEFISGVNSLTDEAAWLLPGDLLHQLKHSLNPLKFLEEIAAQLDLEQLFSATVFSAFSEL